MFYPYLTYGVLLWGSDCQTHMKKLEIMQKKAVRIVAKEAYNSHTDPLFSHFNLLKLVDIYKLNLGKYMYCRVHHLLPEPINQTIVPNEKIYQHDTRSKHSVHIEARHTKLSTNSFIHADAEY